MRILLTAFVAAVLALPASAAWAQPAPARKVTYRSADGVMCDFVALPALGLSNWRGKRPEVTYFVATPGSLNERSTISARGQVDPSTGTVIVSMFSFRIHDQALADTRVGSARLFIDGRDTGGIPTVSHRRAKTGSGWDPNVYADLNASTAINATLPRASKAQIVLYTGSGAEVARAGFDISRFREVPAALKAANYSCDGPAQAPAAPPPAPARAPTSPGSGPVIRQIPPPGTVMTGVAGRPNVLFSDTAHAFAIELVETAGDMVELRARGPRRYGVAIGIDRNANGLLEPNEDIGYGRTPDDGPCAVYQAYAGTSTCGAFASAGRFAVQYAGDVRTTIWTVPRRELSRDGRQFGLRLEGFDTVARTELWTLGGYYRFSGAGTGAGSAPAPAPGAQDSKAQDLVGVESYGKTSGFLSRCRVRPHREVEAIRLLAWRIGAQDISDTERSAAFRQGERSAAGLACTDATFRPTAARLAQAAFLVMTTPPAKDALCGWKGDQALVDRNRGVASQGLTAAEIAETRNVGAQLAPSTCLRWDTSYGRNLSSLYEHAGEPYRNAFTSAFVPPRDLGSWEQVIWATYITTFTAPGGGARNNYVLVSYQLDGREWALRVGRDGVEGGTSGVGAALRGMRVEFYADEGAARPVATYAATLSNSAWRFGTDLMAALKSPPGPILRIQALADVEGRTAWTPSDPFKLGDFNSAWNWVYGAGVVN